MNNGWMDVGGGICGCLFIGRFRSVDGSIVECDEMWFCFRCGVIVVAANVWSARKDFSSKNHSF